jgi:DNA-binding transcriptional ArsR family regulator
MGSKDRQGVKEKGAKAPASPDLEAQRFELLNHPWRVRILDVLVERNMSVSQFVDEGLIPELAPMDRHLAISKLAYHFRVLRNAGALEVIEEHSRRGSTELVCRASVRAHFPDEQWKKMPQHERRAISQIVLHAFFARAECAVQHDTFDSRPDRHLSWLAVEVDEQGWSEIASVLNGVLDTVTAIQRESKGRLETSGEKPIRATWGQLHFESPPLLATPATD